MWGRRLMIGAVYDVVDAVGRETHSMEYGRKRRAQPVLDLDEGTLDIDVCETVASPPHTAETVSELREYGLETGRFGPLTRTVKIPNVVIHILEQRGND